MFQEYTDLIRPHSLNIDTNEILNRTSSFIHQRDKSMDEETSPSVFGNNYEEVEIVFYIYSYSTAYSLSLVKIQRMKSRRIALRIS